jgi:hypothetical protein
VTLDEFLYRGVEIFPDGGFDFSEERLHIGAGWLCEEFAVVLPDV